MIGRGNRLLNVALARTDCSRLVDAMAPITIVLYDDSIARSNLHMRISLC